MHKRLFGLLASAAIVFTACSGNSTPAPASATAPATQPAASVPATTPASEVPSASAAAPGPDLTKTTYFDNVTPAGKTGGTVVMAEWQSVAIFNPYYSNANTDFEVITPSFDWLLTISQDLKYVPDLASNVPTVANGDVVLNGAGMDVTWKLKPGMKWSDGSAINCADFEATWKWVVDKDQVGLPAGVLGWEDITAIDGGTGTDCVVHYKKIYSAYLLMGTAILPKAYIESVPVKDAATKLYRLADPTKAPYSGPYIPTEIKPDAQVTYKPNPNWATVGYGADTSKNHAPYLDKLIMKYYGDAPTMIAGYRAGEIDMAQDLQDSDAQAVTDIPKEEKLIQDQLFNESFYFNIKSFKAKFGETDGPQIIRAVMEATNVDAIIAGPLGGAVTRACSFVNPGLYFFKQEQCIKYDTAAAETALDALGWTKDPTTGIRTKGGVPINLDYCTTTRPYRGDAIRLAVAQLKQIGINGTATSRPANPDVFGDWSTPPDTKCNTIHGNFDVVLHGFISSPDPTGGSLLYTTKGNPDVPPHTGQNEMRVSIPAMDAAYDIVNTTLDPEKIVEAYSTIQDIYGSDQNDFELPLFNHTNLYLVSPHLHNFVGNPSTATSQWNVGDWWTDR